MSAEHKTDRVTAQGVQLLREALLEKTRRNPAYSLRAFARDAGVSPTFVSQVFSGKKKLSFDRALHFGQCLRLDEGQMRQLLRSTALEAARGKNSKAQLEALLGEVADGSPSNVLLLELDRFKVLSHWYYVALMDLTTTHDFKPDVEWVARRLGLSALEVRSAVERLERLGLLELKDGTWSKTAIKLRIAPEQSHSVVREFHRQMIGKAFDALSDSAPGAFDRRDITGITMAIDPSKLGEASKMIEKFREKLTELLTQGECTEVFQLNVQLFGLTQPVRPNAEAKRGENRPLKRER